MNLKKDIQGKNVEASFGVVFKRPSIIFHNIFIKVDNTLEMEGRLQFTEKFDDKFNNVYEFRDVSFYDADLSFLDLTLLKFKQGETTFQKMVGMRRANVEYSYSMHNAKFEENILDYGKL